MRCESVPELSQLMSFKVYCDCCLFSVVMSAEESLNEGEMDPADGEMYEVGGDEDGNGDQPSWSSLTVAALKSALVERGLQTTGRKADLVARLQASQTGRLQRCLCVTRQLRV